MPQAKFVRLASDSVSLNVRRIGEASTRTVVPGPSGNLRLILFWGTAGDARIRGGVAKETPG